MPANAPAPPVPTPPAASSALGAILQAFINWFIGRQRQPGPRVTPVPSTPALDGTPWLTVMRSLVGTQWASGTMPAALQEWQKVIIAKYPDLDMAAYFASAGSGYFSWCGFAVAYCLAKSSDIRPPFGARDVDKFLWADAWRTEKFGQVPDVVQPGDVLTFDFGGGDHHVTLLDHADGDIYVCIGGNQNHQVKLSSYRKAQCTAIRTPTTERGST